MHTEIYSLNSRLTIKNKAIFEKKLKTNTEEGFTRLIAFVALLALLVLCIDKIIEEKNYLFIVQVILILVWLEPHIKRIYLSLFVKTWKSSIKLNEIQKITSIRLDNGLETEVILHLKSGKKKFIVFRDAEKQIEEFIIAVGKPENNFVGLIKQGYCKYQVLCH